MNFSCICLMFLNFILNSVQNTTEKMKPKLKKLYQLRKFVDLQFCFHRILKISSETANTKGFSRHNQKIELRNSIISCKIL